MSDFQASGVAQGRQFAEQCDQLLHHLRFELRGKRNLRQIGVEIDQFAVAPSGEEVWFEYKGSVQGDRPGLRRTDTLKKAIANGALLKAWGEAARYVILTSHLPTEGAGFAMLELAKSAGFFHDVICIYDPSSQSRLRRL
jgi:hypothetical protein